MYQVKFQKPISEPLPTMYDLPSEDPEEPGLPDEFHDFQLKLLRETCVPPNYPQGEIFIGADLNLYYDKNCTGWCERPEWFLCLGVTSDTEQQDVRYVMWQEAVSPFLVVEHEFRLFRLMPTEYEEMMLQNRRFWFEELQLGLGVWDGVYQGKNGQWLRWYDGAGEWIPTEAEARRVAEQQTRIEAGARQVAEQQARMEAETRRMAIPRLARMGLTASQIAEALSLPMEDVEGST
jgi:hypothetical protein